jgi:hypothetical protein
MEQKVEILTLEQFAELPRKERKAKINEYIKQYGCEKLSEVWDIPARVIARISMVLSYDNVWDYIRDWY